MELTGAFRGEAPTTARGDQILGAFDFKRGRAPVYSLNRAAMSEENIRVIGREASLYLWVEVPGGDDEAYATRLLDAGIVVSPGRIFGVDGAGRGYIRLAMVPTLEQCKAAIEAWRALEA